MPKRDDRNYKTGKSSNPRAHTNEPGYGASTLPQLYGSDSGKWTYDDDTKMREAQFLSFLSGVPLVGGFVRGIQSARYMDDYYRNTGFIPSYPGLNDPYGGYSGLARAGSNLASAVASRGGSAGYNVKEGTNDLLSFYNYAYQ